MAMTNTTKMANRYGLNLKFTNVKDETDTATIDFVNEVSIEVTGEITWATGGQAHGKMIGFKDPREGTLRISTQVTDMRLMHLIAGGKLTDTGKVAKFKDDIRVALKYYKIEGDTVWQDEEGTTYEEHITAYKCLVKPNYNATYNGSGDPISLDIEFDLATDADGNFLDIERHDAGDLAYAVVAPIEQQTYSDAAVTPDVTVTYNGKELTKGVDYEVTYSDNDKAGTGKATIKGKEGSEYTGEQTVEFTIVQG